MTRILLPLAIVAVMFLTPFFAVEQTSDALGTDTSNIDGNYFIGNAIDCLIGLEIPLGEECAFDGDFYDSPMVGQVMTWSALLALGAAALGVIGLLPFIGRVTSIVTVLAGAGAVGAVGYMAMVLIGTDDGLGAIRWGAYLAAGCGLLTVISGLGGMRGR